MKINPELKESIKNIQDKKIENFPEEINEYKKANILASDEIKIQEILRSDEDLRKLKESALKRQYISDLSAQIDDNSLKNQNKKKIAEESEKAHNQTCSDIAWFNERQKISLPAQINDKCLSKSKNESPINANSIIFDDFKDGLKEKLNEQKKGEEKARIAQINKSKSKDFSKNLAQECRVETGGNFILPSEIKESEENMKVKKTQIREAMQSDIAAHQTRRQNEKVKNVLFDLEVGKQLKEREDSLKKDIKQKNVEKQNECKKLAQFLKDQIAQKKQSEVKNTCKQSANLHQEDSTNNNESTELDKKFKSKSFKSDYACQLKQQIDENAARKIAAKVERIKQEKQKIVQESQDYDRLKKMAEQRI